MYQNVLLHIDGKWVGGSATETIEVINPATKATLATVAEVTTSDFYRALEAAEVGFKV